MDEIILRQLFKSLWDDFKEAQDYTNNLFLAHYTSIEVLESIIKNNEVWFSHPLFMNDISEVKFGLDVAIPLVLNNKEIDHACQSPERITIFKDAFLSFNNSFVNGHVAHTYIFCLSEHIGNNTDGLLSMWRGYGSNGNGVAIIFETAKISPINEAPFILGKVNYTTRDGLVDIISVIILKFATILQSTYIPDEELHKTAFVLYERIKLLSLFTKYKGFEEEHEWRLVYVIERDFENILEPRFSYCIGLRGIEPKLKFKIEPIQGITGDDLSLTEIVNQIIIGPSNSSPLAKQTIFRMFKELKKPEMEGKIHISTIPFRAK